MDFKEIQELIKLINKSTITEFKLEEGDTKIVIKTSSGESATPAVQYISQAPIAVPAPVVAVPPAAPVAVSAPVAEAPKAVEAAAPAAADSNAGLLEITSPIVGTFYRTPGPNKEAYVKVGDAVDKGKVVCIVEAMKLFNEIESEVKGKIVKVLLEDASPVEYGQPLFLVDPKG
jgi:acetyl-CoA carboxylase biotin carboxyl carrier protein